MTNSELITAFCKHFSIHILDGSKHVMLRAKDGSHTSVLVADEIEPTELVNEILNEG